MASHLSTHDGAEINDKEGAHALAVGTAVGVPALYVVVLVIALVAGAPVVDAMVIAIWPAVVGGPFFGSVVALSSALQRSTHGDVVGLPAQSQVPPGARRRAA